MSSPVICWDVNGTILNEEFSTETAELKRENSIKYKTSEISYEDEERPRNISTFWEITPRKNIASVLEGLIGSGYKNIVTTNAGNLSEIEKVLSSLNLKKYFEGVYCVSIGRFGKDYSFALQQQGLSEIEMLRKAIAIGNEYDRDCPINPLGMPLILDNRPFYESSSVDVMLAITELFGAGKEDFSKGFERIFLNKSSKLNFSLRENVDSRSEHFGELVIPVINL
jgi:FMN phosphatase YigB (HAD superfamily)